MKWHNAGTYLLKLTYLNTAAYILLVWSQWAT